MVALPDYSPPEDCTPPARVHIGDKRLPIINEGVTTQIRKDGPTDVVRYSEVHFPAQWKGDNYARLFDAATTTEEIVESITRLGLANTSLPQTLADPIADDVGFDEIVDVEFRDHVTGEYVLAHRGYVGGFGGGNGTANELRLAIKDPAKLLGIPASYSHSDSGSIVDILEYVVSTLEDGQPIFNDIPIFYHFSDDNVATVRSSDGQSIDDEGGPPFGPIEREDLYDAQRKRGMDLSLGAATKKFQFTRNRHNLTDILTKLIEEVGLYLWFAPFGNGRICLHVTDVPHNHYTAHSGDRDESESIDLRKNDALYEVSPPNALEVRGEVSEEIVRMEDDGLSEDRKQFQDVDLTYVYPYAIIQHDPSVNRAGGRITQSYESDTETEEGAIADGRRELKKRMDSTGRGTMVAELAPQLKSFDTLLARPVCGDIAANVPPLNWEIENVNHTASGGSIPLSELQVSPTVIADELTVVESGYREP